MTATALAWVAFGGALGAVGRYLAVAAIAGLMGGAFPYGTLAVNVAGCLVLGLLAEAMAAVWPASQEMRAFLVAGLLGAFTTFSAFSLDTVDLVERGHLAAAAAYVLASVALSILALAVGLKAMRLVLA